MINSKTFNKMPIFLISGFTAGALSLVFLSILFPSKIFNTLNFDIIFLSTLLEEVSKLIILIFIAKNLISQKHTISPGQQILWGLIFGTGFSLFELLLLSLQQEFIQYIYPSFIISIMIHLLTGIILTMGILSQRKFKLSTVMLVFFLLAFFIHLCYNLIILNLKI